MSTDVIATLAALLVIWLAAKLGGEVMERLGQPAVLGELLAGVLIGPGVLGIARETKVLHLLAEIGVVLLLFEIGLESDLDELLKAGGRTPRAGSADRSGADTPRACLGRLHPRCLAGGGNL